MLSHIGNRLKYVGIYADSCWKLVVRALPWKHKQAPISHFPSRPPAKANVHIVDNSRQSEEVEEELGLGDWDSDEDTAVPPRGKQRYMRTLAISPEAKFYSLFSLYESHNESSQHPLL